MVGSSIGWHTSSDGTAGIIYSVIAPLILPFCVLGFCLIYLAFQYNLLFVVRPKYAHEGLLYPSALKQLLTGVYVMEMCCTGLFLLVRAENNHFACIGQAAITILATCGTIAFHIFVNQGIGRLVHDQPIASTRQDCPSKTVVSSLVSDECSASSQCSSVALQDQTVHVPRPTIWIPLDCLGIAEHEISETEDRSGDLQISTENAVIDRNGCVGVTGEPPQ